MPSSSNRLVCLYGHGSASPSQIASILPELAPLHVVVEPNPQSDAAYEIFRSLDVSVSRWGDGTSLEGAGYLTFAEDQVRLTAELARVFNRPGLGEGAASALTDKLAQRQQLLAKGVPGPRFHRADSLAHLRNALAGRSEPLVVKPRSGWGSRGTALVSAGTLERTLSELDELMSSGGYIVEEVLIGGDHSPFGDYCSVEVAVSAGHPVVLGVTGKFPLVPQFREPGQFWPAGLRPEEEAAAASMATGVVAALEVQDGLLHVELKLTQQGPVLIEANGRLGGFTHELYHAAAGINLIRTAGAVALGLSTPLEQPTFEQPRRHSVTYQYHNLLPRFECDLIGIRSADTVRGHGQVAFYRRLAHLGRHLGGAGTRELDILMATSPSHAQITPDINRLESQLLFDIQLNDGDRKLVSPVELFAMNKVSVTTED